MPRLAMISTPQSRKPISLETFTATRLNSGCTCSVTSSASPPVDRLALSKRQTRSPSFGTDFSPIPYRLSFSVILGSSVLTFVSRPWTMNCLCFSNISWLTVDLPFPATFRGKRS